MTDGEGNHKDNSDCHGNDDVKADSPRGTVGYRPTDQRPKGQSSALNGAANPKNGGPTLERRGIGNDAGRISVYYTIAILYNIQSALKASHAYARINARCT